MNKKKGEAFEAFMNLAIFTIFAACVANLAGTWVAGVAAFTGLQSLAILKHW